MNVCPAVLITAPASGQGKTTIACALARLHARRGAAVRLFKCGPDFLDPYWHALASGAPVHQLDLWINGETDCRKRLAAAAQQADLIIIEGVMGLFDGQPSAADLARRFSLPLLAVINAASMAGTFGALALGLRNYAPDLSWVGVLANRVASPRHAAMLKNSVRTSEQWLGAMPRNAALTLPERHLGLTVASEVSDAMLRLDASADALAQIPLGQLSLSDWQQRWQVAFDQPEPASAATVGAGLLAGRTIAVARDAAFCFVYAANLDCLQSLGARLVFFSPLAGESLPDCDALWLPGGYPELHAQRLAQCHRLRADLAAHIAAAKPVWAECGGMMVLFEQLTTLDGQCQPQWGLLPGGVTMQQRLVAVGPQQLKLASGTLRGHTFHYSSVQTHLSPLTRTARPLTDLLPDAGEALWQHGSVRASYFHAWFASCPPAAAELFSQPTLAALGPA